MAENGCSNQHKHRYGHIFTASKHFCLFLSDFILVFSLFCLLNTKQQHFASYAVPCVSCLPVQTSKTDIYIYQPIYSIAVHLPSPQYIHVHFFFYASSVCKFNRNTMCTMLFFHVTSWNMPQHFLSPPQAHIHDDVSALQPCILKLDLSSDHLVQSLRLSAGCDLRMPPDDPFISQGDKATHYTHPRFVL